MKQQKSERIYLSPPSMGQLEREFVKEAFDTNWIAPAGPHIDAFEEEFADRVGARRAVAVSSGTAALHLALQTLGIREDDDVCVSTLTFCASVNPILYQRARPIFIDSERESWNMDPVLLEEFLESRAAENDLPDAVIVVHLYGQTADLEAICDLCEEYGIPLIEDAAEALGAAYGDRSPGTFGNAGIFSFNGNKIITTSGGGMLVTDDPEMASTARKLATQAREPVPHYEHETVGYNYRMSNVLAGIGRGQLRRLEEYVAVCRQNFDFYKSRLDDLPGLEFMPEADWGTHSRWLVCATIDPEEAGCDREDVRHALEEENIEARPVWKPMHLQPVYSDYQHIGGDVAENLFRTGLCLPSGTDLTEVQLQRITDIIRRQFE